MLRLYPKRRIFLFTRHALHKERFTVNENRLYDVVKSHITPSSIHPRAREKPSVIRWQYFPSLRRKVLSRHRPFEKNALQETSIFAYIVNIHESFILLYCVLSPNVLYRPIPDLLTQSLPSNLSL
jgi:hypothetical protein